MVEQQKGPQAPAPKLAIKQMDTTKYGVKKYLDEAAKKTKEGFHAGSSAKLAAGRFCADMLGLVIGSPERIEFFKQWDATPGWFGCGNNSACRQAFENKSDADGVAADYTDC